MKSLNNSFKDKSQGRCYRETEIISENIAGLCKPIMNSFDLNPSQPNSSEDKNFFDGQRKMNVKTNKSYFVRPKFFTDVIEICMP